MIYAFDQFELDEDLFELRANGRKVAAQPKVLQFLFFLVRHHPKAVDKKDVIANVWGDIVVTDAALARVVMEVRKAIGDSSQERLVTVRGRGFRLTMDLESRAPSAPTRESGLIGREPCILALTSRLEDALAGHRRFAIVSGPPGIGKTRVLEEIARIASARGVAACSVRGVDQDEKSDVAETMSHALAAAGNAKPLVVLVDDLHFADDASLDVLQAFVRDASSARVLVVAAHRDVPAVTGARASVIRDLLSDSGTLSIPLRGLSIEEVARLIESVTRMTSSGLVAGAIHKRSGGIPHYVHQLLETKWAETALRADSHEVASSVDLQPGIIESITRHLDAISPETREVLVDAALLGHEFAFATLAAATAMPRGDLHDRVDEAVTARLVIKKKNDSYEFAHALVADVLSKGMPSAARAKRHGAIGERLLRHYGDAADLHSVELANHFVRALSGGDPENAITFSIRAAEQHGLVGANGAAVKSWANAAHAFGFVHGYDPRRSVVQIELARARSRAGDANGAREACLDGVLLARAFRRPDALVDAAIVYADLTTADDPRRATILGEALAVLDELPSDRAESLRERLGGVQSAQRH